jgi:hypothetical protein
MAKTGLLHRLSNVRLLVGALIALLVGLFLLYIAGRNDWMLGRGGLKSVLDDVGGALIASVALAALWELAGKRAFTKEILDEVRTTMDVTTAGLDSIGTNYLTDPDWARLFAGVEKLDIFLAYGRTWRNTNDPHLKAMAERRGTRIRLFIPDPADVESIGRLAQRFSMDPTRVKDAVSETEEYFRRLEQHGVGDVEVYYWRGDHTFSCYRLDRTAVLTLYTHSRQRTQVPTLICHEGGTLYEFIRQEFSAIERQSTSVV